MGGKAFGNIVPALVTMGSNLAFPGMGALTAGLVYGGTHYAINRDLPSAITGGALAGIGHWAGGHLADRVGHSKGLVNIVSPLGSRAVGRAAIQAGMAAITATLGKQLLRPPSSSTSRALNEIQLGYMERLAELQQRIRTIPERTADRSLDTYIKFHDVVSSRKRIGETDSVESHHPIPRTASEFSSISKIRLREGGPLENARSQSREVRKFISDRLNWIKGQENKKRLRSAVTLRYGGK